MNTEIAIILLVIVGVTLLLKVKNVSNHIVWLIGLSIFPTAILIDEFILPYRGGGASMWPIAIVVSIFYSLLGVAIGTSIAGYIKRNRNDET